MDDNSPPSASPAKPRSSKKRLLLAGGAVVAACILGFAFLRPQASHKTHHGAADSSQSQPVAVQTVHAGSMPVELTELGTVVPITNVTVQTRVEGYLMQVLFTEGQHVHKGDLLALIDPAPIRCNWSSMKASLPRTRHSLNRQGWTAGATSA